MELLQLNTPVYEQKGYVNTHDLLTFQAQCGKVEHVDIYGVDQEDTREELEPMYEDSFYMTDSNIAFAWNPKKF